MSLATPLLIYSLSLGGDAWSTQRALRNPAVHESNRLMQNPVVMVGSHVLVGAGLTVIDRQLEKRSKAGVWALRLGVLAGGVYVTQHNLHNAGRKR